MLAIGLGRRRGQKSKKNWLTSFVNGPLVTSKLISVAEEKMLRMISLIFVMSMTAVNAEPQYPLTRWEFGIKFL